MKLSIEFPELGTVLMNQLLKCSGEKQKTRSPVVNVATVELIYQLGKKQDSSYEDRSGITIYSLVRYEAAYAVNKIQVAFGSSFLDCLTCVVFPLFGPSQAEPKSCVVCLLALSVQVFT